MKILEISERGIKIIEDGEVINQALFNENENIPFEVKELLCIYDEPDQINLKILFDLEESIVLEIKEGVKEIGWRLKEAKKIDKKFKWGVLSILTFELVLGCVIFLKNLALEKNILELKKENIAYRKTLTSLGEKIKETEIDEEIDLEIFQKSELSKFLIFLSEVSKKSKVSYEKIQILDKKILIDGFGMDMESVSELKKLISGHKNIKESKFDFIKKEGEILYFLIELEQR